jgi:hypothetical protein
MKGSPVWKCIRLRIQVVACNGKQAVIMRAECVAPDSLSHDNTAQDVVFLSC